ncbi:hypothetical protein H5398_16090 [Tessaracoccus sp. MC1679]|uniref:hypothetical protein n=1 Tax=Tessaracoccus sp. MC1679 TaxID=2760313 RepID=UPI001602486A|nr:hypothetical protein [Tessaracoccus sp. MC1679]MBB1517471.1 hypothetical protein [Tessaracoccus sp. MC1679]
MTFSEKNEAFRALMSRAITAVESDETEYLSGLRRLCVVVDVSSPAHQETQQLCELARRDPDATRFIEGIRRRGGEAAKRWQAFVAGSDGSEETAQKILQVLEIHAVAVRDGQRDWIDALNRLARLWVPADDMKADRALHALHSSLITLNTVAGYIDHQVLASQPSLGLPANLSSHTRRDKLHQARREGTARVSARLQAIGLPEDEADQLAIEILDRPALSLPDRKTFLTGPMGAGKSTEAERQHRRAIDEALESPSAPIPVFLPAWSLLTGPLLPHLEQNWAGIADLGRVGVHLVIDGLDEAGLRYDEVSFRAAGVLADNPQSRLIAVGRPEIPETQTARMVHLPEPDHNEMNHLARQIDPSLMSLPPWLGDQDLRHPLFAIRYALDHRERGLAPTTRHGLIESVARHATQDLDDDKSFELLMSLATLVTDRGGSPVPLTTLHATPPEVQRLARSRICMLSNQGLSFQVAALTEYFGAEALRRTPDLLGRVLGSVSSLDNWRYPILYLASSSQAEGLDALLVRLCDDAPGVAGWVMSNLPKDQELVGGAPGVIADVKDIVPRVRKALVRCLSPFKPLADRWLSAGKPPALRAWSANGSYSLQWHGGAPAGTVEYSQPVPFEIAISDDSWYRTNYGRLDEEGRWPWHLAFTWVHGELMSELEGLKLVRYLPAARAELAWAYANAMVGRSGFGGVPVDVAEMKTILTQIRDAVSRHDTSDVRPQDVQFQNGLNLAEAEHFVAEVEAQDLVSVSDPWPSPDTTGTRAHLFYTPSQLEKRLELTSLNGLQIYTELVDQSFPTLARELRTSHSIPALVEGHSVSTPTGNWNEDVAFRWRIVEARSSRNESRWLLGRTSADDPPDQAVNFSSPGYGWSRNIFGTSITPSIDFALDLLAEDLQQLGWAGHTSRRLRRQTPPPPSMAECDHKSPGSTMPSCSPGLTASQDAFKGHQSRQQPTA